MEFGVGRYKFIVRSGNEKIIVAFALEKCSCLFFMTIVVFIVAVLDV